MLRPVHPYQRRRLDPRRIARGVRPSRIRLPAPLHKRTR